MNSLRFFKEMQKFRQWPALTAQRCMALKADAKHGQSDEDDRNEAVPFFGSRAATWRARDTRSGGHDKYVWYQPYVISVSLSVFLIYFCILREESDIDLKLEGNLFNHVQGLEEVQLTLTYKHNKENGLDNKEIISRLKELGIDVNLLDDKTSEGN